MYILVRGWLHRLESIKNNPKSLVMENISPTRYVSYISLVSSSNEPSIYLEEEMCDTLMEDDANIDPKFGARVFGFY